MKQLTGLAVLLLLLTGCGRHQRIDLSDVTKPVTLTLIPPPEKLGEVSHLKLRIRGRIDGSAQISATDLPTNNVGKRFTIERSGGYSRSNCIVRYVPDGVHSGRITIQYDFN